MKDPWTPNARPDIYAAARAALSQIPHAVAIIAGAHGDERSCATGTCMYVSLAPPQLAIAEHPGSRTFKLIQASGEFSVSLLRPEQQPLAMAAGRSAKGSDKFAALGIPTAAAPDGMSVPGVLGSVAVLWCRVVSSAPTGDHLLIVGEIVDHRVGDGSGALLRFQRRYFGIGDATSGEAPEGYPI